jgi:DNA-binding PadR family transcriptional regulator
MPTELSALGRYGELARLMLTCFTRMDHTAQTLQETIGQDTTRRLEPGTLYGPLAALEQYGWIELLEIDGAHRLYSLTDAGASALSGEQERRSRQRRHRQRCLMKAMTGIQVLYPQRWRERYGDEMQALLERHPVTLFTVVDGLQSALDARLNLHKKTLPLHPPQQDQQQLHAAYNSTLLAGAAFLIGSIVFTVMPGMVCGCPFYSLGRLADIGMWMGLYVVTVLQVLLAFSLLTQKSTMVCKVLQLLPTLGFFLSLNLIYSQLPFMVCDVSPFRTRLVVGMVGDGLMPRHIIESGVILAIASLALNVCVVALNAYVVARNHLGEWVPRLAPLPTTCLFLGMMAIAAIPLVYVPLSLGDIYFNPWMIIGFLVLSLIMVFTALALLSGWMALLPEWSRRSVKW